MAKAEVIEQVTIADRNLEVARQIANRLQKERARVDVKSVDANDHDGLVEAMRGYDVAASYQLYLNCTLIGERRSI